MQVTMSILFEKLSVEYRCQKSPNDFSDHHIQSLLLYCPGNLSPDCVYVARGCELRPQDLAGASVISAGQPSFDYRSISCDLIVVEDALDARSLFNQVQQIYLSMIRWDIRLASIASNELDLDAMLDEGRRKLRYSFVFLNKSFKPMATSGDLRRGQWNEMDPELLGQVLRFPCMEDKAHHDKPREFADPASGKKGLYFNAFCRKDYRGKLVAFCESGHSITRGEFSIFATICTHLEKLYERFSASSVRSIGYIQIQEAILTVLSGSPAFDKADLLAALLIAGWKPNDEYAVFIIPFGENDRLPAQGEYLVTLIENRWNQLCSDCARGVVMDCGVAWVVNKTVAADAAFDTVLPELESILRRFGAKLGVSTVCRDFFSLPTYLKQANIAIHLGQRKNPDGVIFPFNRYSLDYMLGRMLDNFTVEDMIHPCLPTLMAYDRENNAELCKTLRMLIRSKYNVLQASNSLFIHRSTFSVRIKRIEELCGIDLEDERTRLHILLSFYILEENGLIKE